MTSEVLQVSKVADVFIGVTQTATTMRDDALAVAADIVSVRNELQAHMAGSALEDLKQIRISVEKSRKAVKEPVLELGRKIDRMATEFIEGVETHERRIQQMLNSYAADQLKIQREAEAARQREVLLAEQARIRAIQDAEKAQRAAVAEAEKLRAEAEAEQDAQRKLEAERAANAAGLKAAEMRSENIEKASEMKQAVLEMAAAPVVAAKIPEALRIKETWDYDILNAEEAYKERPDFFELVPKRKVILDALSAGKRSCNGLRIYLRTEAR